MENKPKHIASNFVARFIPALTAVITGLLLAFPEVRQACTAFVP